MELIGQKAQQKEITIGLLDGQYSNRVDVLHFENILDIDELEFKN